MHWTSSRSQKGFTLIELLIVTALLGLMAGIVIPNFGSIIGNSKQNAANIELENIKTASVSYLGENGVWPDDSSELTILLAGTPKATYLFDTSTGYITGAVDITWTGLTFIIPPGPPYTHHGEWKKS
jgi:prepilin-type N-terminal cleavage/methylation domain-containing protein